MRSVDADGHLRVEMSRISKANICGYRASEIPGAQALGLDPDKMYRLLRDPSELALAADSFSNKPLLIRHVPISAEAPRKELWVGTTGKCTFEPPYLVSRPLMVWTQEAIDLIASEEQRELSCGYRYRCDMTPGTYEGETFDGIMRSISGQHVAIVSEGRAGPDVLVADQLPVEFSMKHSAVYEKLKSYFLPNVDLIALDGVLGEVASTSPSLGRDEEKEKEQEAKDCANDYYQNAKDAWENMSAEDKQTARDEWEEKEKAKDKKAKDKAAKDKAARDGNPDHRDDFDGAKDGITADQLKTAMDDAVKLAREEVNALHAAREAVKPIVGVVAMDSAEEVYRFALKHAGIANADKIHASALPALLDVVKSRKAPTPTVAFDSAHAEFSLDSIFPVRKRA